jgi:hypothetical protein
MSTPPRNDRYAVIVIDRSTGVPLLHGVCEGDVGANEAHDIARTLDQSTSHQAMVVGLKLQPPTVA